MLLREKNVLERCCKNGKMTFWVSADEKATVPAPTPKVSLKHLRVLIVVLVLVLFPFIVFFFRC
jgi:hypothetical protein